MGFGDGVTVDCIRRRAEALIHVTCIAALRYVVLENDLSLLSMCIDTTNSCTGAIEHEIESIPVTSMYSDLAWHSRRGPGRLLSQSDYALRSL